MKPTEYPQWKILAWRFGRIFLATFLVEISMALDKITKVEDIYPLIILPALSASIATAAKAIRDWWGDQLPLVNKMPL